MQIFTIVLTLLCFVCFDVYQHTPSVLKMSFIFHIFMSRKPSSDWAWYLANSEREFLRYFLVMSSPWRKGKEKGTQSMCKEFSTEYLSIFTITFSWKEVKIILHFLTWFTLIQNVNQRLMCNSIYGLGWGQEWGTQSNT